VDVPAEDPHDLRVGADDLGQSNGVEQADPVEERDPDRDGRVVHRDESRGLRSLGELRLQPGQLIGAHAAGSLAGE